VGLHAAVLVFGDGPFVFMESLPDAPAEGVRKARGSEVGGQTADVLPQFGDVTVGAGDVAATRPAPGPCRPAAGGVVVLVSAGGGLRPVNAGKECAVVDVEVRVGQRVPNPSMTCPHMAGAPRRIGGPTSTDGSRARRLHPLLLSHGNGGDIGFVRPRYRAAGTSTRTGI